MFLYNSIGIFIPLFYKFKVDSRKNKLLHFESVSIKLDANTQFCLGEMARGKDSCSGDSGGPVFLKDEVSNEFVQGVQKCVIDEIIDLVII